MPIVGKHVSKESDVFTDELISYVNLNKNGYNHQIVNHGKREFVRSKDIHTNSIEGFWAHFKRVVFGTYHCVSKDYLQRYIDEQVYRWNTRKESATKRFRDMFAKSVKSFEYKDVLRLSTLIDEEIWAAKHRSYYHPKAA